MSARAGTVISRRRAIVALLLLAAPLAAHAQPKGREVPTVGVLTPQRLRDTPPYAAFLETLRHLGYEPERNLRIVLRSADGHLDRLPVLASELVAARVDVIVAVNTPGARAAISATKQIPIVITAVGDPVGSGFVATLARPGGNVTGVSNMIAALAPKRLSILKEVVPGAARVAVLFNPEDPITAPQMLDLHTAAPALQVEIRLFPVKAVDTLADTFKAMLAWRADAVLWLAGQQHAFQRRSTELPAHHRLPLMVVNRHDVEAGGLISYLSDTVDVYRRTAVYVDRILKGATPSDLPIEQPTKFELVINLKTARSLGVTIPPRLLLQADRVVE